MLVNAWDVASALVLASLPRCRAIATSSAAVAATLGYQDGEAIPRNVMLDAVARIADAVHVPTTADLEAGYGPDVEAAVATAEGAIAAGAVGLNFEDGRRSAELLDTDAQAARITAIVETGKRAGVPLVVNARVDVFLLGIGEPEGRFDETLRRADAYLEAGADCVFVPGVTDAETIGRLVDAIEGPVSVLATAGTPSVGELESLGVARVSVGSGSFRALLPQLERIGREVLERGDFAVLAEAASSADVARLLRGESRHTTGKE